MVSPATSRAGRAIALSEQLRLFVSIELPAEIKAALSKAQAEIRRAVPDATARYIVEQIRRHEAGETLQNVVDPARGY